MKRFLIASLALVFAAANASFAQSSYDDVYYSGSQAQQDAQKQQKKQKNKTTNYYNSSDQYGYDYGENDGNEMVRNSYENPDNYIDYDDDSYTMRMRRFYYPMAGVGYWGSVYSPYWMNPYYGNPFYYGWYTPGISFSFGFGFGPYWNSYWGINTWYGFGPFSPYYGYGGYYGYGFGGWGSYYAGYWNGYYSGYYDGRYGYGNSPYHAVNYGPRGARGDLRSTGNYATGSRTPIRTGVVNPQRSLTDRSGRAQGDLRGTPTLRQGDRMAPSPSGRRGEPTLQNGRSERFPNSNLQDGRIRLNEQNQQNIDRRPEMQQGLDRRQGTQPSIDRRQEMQPTPQQSAPSRSIFRRNQNTSPSPSQRMESTPAPRTQPNRSYTPPARSVSPSRSSSPAPSRGFSSPSGGGGRSGGSIRR